MGKKEKLYNKAKSSSTNLSFNEICQLAEKVGFNFRNQNGSHKIYKHQELGKIMNFQPDSHDKSKAKKYQVDQLIAIIDEHDLI